MFRYCKLYLVLLALFFMTFLSNAQSLLNIGPQIAILQQQNDKKPKIKHKKMPLLLLVYKNFITTQDGNSCAFTPICSVYAIRQVKKHGIFIGLLYAADRLTRCGDIAGDFYKWNENMERYEDIH